MRHALYVVVGALLLFGACHGLAAIGDVARPTIDELDGVRRCVAGAEHRLCVPEPNLFARAGQGFLALFICVICGGAAVGASYFAGLCLHAVGEEAVDRFTPLPRVLRDKKTARIKSAETRGALSTPEEKES